jgi:hypothetical protein
MSTAPGVYEYEYEYVYGNGNGNGNELAGSVH